jgi:Fic family protein
MTPYQPPFSLNDDMLTKVAEIAELLGQWKQSSSEGLVPQLRRGNRIRTIQASLAIEHNSLSVEQVTAVLDGKPVLGLPREIQEVRNAFNAYENLPNWNPGVLDNLLAAHGLLLYGLADDAGCLRAKGVGIYQNQQLVHMAPPPGQVPRLMNNLLSWLANTKAHPLIASCAFHYELEFIHPFSDGNGRIGRLWQTLILSRWQPMLAYLPVETVIKSQQQLYYQTLGEADKAADCSRFIVFMLTAIESALQQAILSGGAQETTQEKAQETTQEKIILLLISEPQLTRKQLAQRLSLTADGVKYHLQKLKASGRIEHVGSTKSGYWRVIK